VNQGVYVDLNASASTDNVGITQYRWTFTEDGFPWTLNGPEVRFQFNIPGVYIVTLEVTDAAGNSATDTITVTAVDIWPPVPRADTLHDIATNTTVEFNASDSTDNVGIISYRWTFQYDGEDVVLAGPMTSYYFHLPGEYLVSLTIVDAAGNDATLAITVSVNDAEPPVIVTELLVRAALEDTVLFDASSSHDNVGIASFNWTFEYDGQNISLASPTPEFTFDLGGIYEVLLEVSDTSGNVASVTVTVSIRDVNAPIADAGEDRTVGQGVFLPLDGSGSTDAGGIVSWEWVYEYDGMRETLEGEKPTIIFDIPGVYDVTLIVEDADGLTDADIVRITVLDTEPPIAYAGEDIVVAEGEEFTLDGFMSSDSVGIVSWTWTIRDQQDAVVSIETGIEVTITLGQGIYNVTLRVEDAAGHEDSDHLTVTVIGPDAPKAVAGPDATVEGGDEHAFDATETTSVNGIESFEWTFAYGGQDITLHGGKPSFTFIRTGTYLVNLTVMDSIGYTGTDVVTITVVDTTLPEALIKVGEQGEGEARVLDGSGSTDIVGITNWTWKVVFENEITYLYGDVVDLHRNDPGRYEITLTVRDTAGHEDLASVSFTITLEDDNQFSFLLVGIIAVIAAITVVVTFFALREVRTSREHKE